MKTKAITLGAMAILLFAGCSKEDQEPQTQPQQQEQVQQEPEPEPEPENSPPTEFTIETAVSKNTASLQWNESQDPDGDTITYSVFIGDSLVLELLETNAQLVNLIFEKEYFGKVVADDGNGHQQQADFTFTTGMQWLTSYEFDSGTGTGYSYVFDQNELFITAITQPSGNATNIVYDGDGLLFSVGQVTYNRNAQGLITRISNGKDKGDLELLYDSQDRISEVSINSTGSNNYTAETQMIFNYNAIGNLESIDFHRIHTSDNTNGPIETFHRRRYFYDNEGNLTEFRFENSDDGVIYEESIKEQYTYDAMKNPWYSLLTNQLGFTSRVIFGLSGAFDPQSTVQYSTEGHAIRFLRSAHNMLSQKVYSSGDLILEYNYEYTYDESGYPITAKQVSQNSETSPQWSY